MTKWCWLILCLILISASLMARSTSTGKALIDTTREYLETLTSGNTDETFSLLSDSLASLVSPAFLRPLVNMPSTTGRIRIGNIEDRGYMLSLSLSEGGSRTIWLRENRSGEWRIAGDTSLDNLLGSATVICTAFARETVIPAVRSGDNPEYFICPVSGEPYFLEENLLFCSSGHLGNGLDIGGSGCRIYRDSLAEVVVDYIIEGYAFPGSFVEMYEQSNGEFSQRGGFRCPDNGYAYYEITPEGVYCPFHEETSKIEFVIIPEQSDSGFITTYNDRENI